MAAQRPAGSPSPSVRRLIIYSPDAFQLATHCYDYVGGLGKAVASTGVDVVVVGWEGPLSHSAPLHEARLARTEGEGRERSIYRRVLGGLGDVTWGMARVWTERRLLAHLGTVVDGARDAAVLFESAEYIALSRFLRRERRTYPRACIFHDTSFNLRHASRVAAAYKYACRPFVREIIRRSDAVFVHGPGMRENLVTSVNAPPALAGRIHAIPYGAPHPDEVQRLDRGPARAQLQLPDGQCLMLAFGTLRRDKRFDVVLRGLAQLPEWHLLVAGPEGDVSYDELLGMARSAGVLDRVRLDRGFVPPQRQPLYFGAADVVVAIYDGSTRHESGTAQLARTFLRPVIAGGGPDLLAYVETTGTGWPVDVRDPGSFARVLAEVDRSGAMRSRQLESRIHACAVSRSWAVVSRTFLSHLGWADAA